MTLYEKASDYLTTFAEQLKSIYSVHVSIVIPLIGEPELLQLKLKSGEDLSAHLQLRLAAATEQLRESLTNGILCDYLEDTPFFWKNVEEQKDIQLTEISLNIFEGRIETLTVRTGLDGAENKRQNFKALIPEEDNHLKFYLQMFSSLKGPFETWEIRNIYTISTFKGPQDKLGAILMYQMLHNKQIPILRDMIKHPQKSLEDAVKDDLRDNHQVEKLKMYMHKNENLISVPLIF